MKLVIEYIETLKKQKRKQKQTQSSTLFDSTSQEDWREPNEIEEWEYLIS